MEVKDGKGYATLTELKNKIGQVLSMADKQEVVITSYNKPKYKLVRLESTMEEPEEKKESEVTPPPVEPKPKEEEEKKPDSQPQKSEAPKPDTTADAPETPSPTPQAPTSTPQPQAKGDLNVDDLLAEIQSDSGAEAKQNQEAQQAETKPKQETSQGSEVSGSDMSPDAAEQTTQSAEGGSTPTPSPEPSASTEQQKPDTPAAPDTTESKPTPSGTKKNETPLIPDMDTWNAANETEQKWLQNTNQLL